MTHPLTDEICDEIQESIWAQEATDEELIKYKAFYIYDRRQQLEQLCIRAAADWQLEQVIEWIQEHVTPDSHYSEFDGNGADLWSYIITDSIVDDLKKAMRPQQKEDN